MTEGVAARKGLGFFPGPVDERDYELRPQIQRMTAPKTKGSMFRSVYVKLDQGSEGACVGFSFTNLYNSTPVSHRNTDRDAYDLYKLAQREYDPWAGDAYEGTSVRAGAMAARARNLIPAFAFTYDLEEIAVWILNKGPVVVGVDWLEGMDDPSRKNDYYVHPTGAVRGGHAICIDGVRWERDSRDYFRMLNSWGPNWGMGGRCRITVGELGDLLRRQGSVCCTAVEKA
jgi:hypothetical protein